jgi:spermidine synthase
MADKRWIAETLFDELGFRMSYRVDKVHYEARTAHQHLLLFEHAFFGKMLMLDGAVQITKRDEFIHQEMMAHVPLFAHGNARDVLIIGGGDCGIAEEALKHKTLQRLVQVEIDASVIEFAKPHFPEFTRPAFADAQFNSIIADATCYVAAVPTYVGGHLAMGWASDDKNLRQTPARTLAARHRRAGSFATKY